MGLSTKPGYIKEPWARIKALARRIAHNWGDEYKDLTPVADLYSELQNRMWISIQQPRGWDGSEPNDQEKESIFSEFADKVSRRLLSICTRRVKNDRVDDWQRAYGLSGNRSTFVRARIIADDIYDKAAPIPDVTPSPGIDGLLDEAMEIVKLAAAETGVTLR